MKIKLVESFGYNQGAINHSKDLVDELDAFIDVLPDYENAMQFISDDDMSKIIEVRNIFSRFNKQYLKFAKTQLKDYYEKKKGI